VSPVASSIRFFRDEYMEHVTGGCPFDPTASTLFASEAVSA
jgi:NADH-quinone oxidoreductase subunit F